MAITRIRTSSLLGGVLAGVTLLVSPQVRAATVLVPIVAGAHGLNRALWSSEVRMTNRTDAPLRLSVIDWIGTNGWRANSFSVPAHAIVSVGGFDFAGLPAGAGSAVAGIAVCTADDALIVQAAILTGTYTISLVEPCPSYNGGGSTCLGPVGAGPTVENLRFAAAGVDTFLPWLHTDEERRTNIVLVNPDDRDAHATLNLSSQDGSVTESAQVVIPPHTYFQINDVFSREPWSAVRTANHAKNVAGSTARVTSDTRLLALVYVIGNDNNSLTISVPR